MEEKQTFGKAVGPDGEKEITSVLQIGFADYRSVDVIGVEDGNIHIFLKNDPKTGRNPEQQLALTRESFVAVNAAMVLYAMQNGIDLESEFKNISGDEMKFYSSHQPEQ